MLKILLSLVLCFYIFPSLAQNKDTILILGDSLSAGYGIKTQESWPVLIQEKLNTLELSFNIHNASISGQTSAEGAAQIKQLLALTQPKLVVLELGANDGLRGLAVQDMQHNLQTMITQSQLAGANVLLVGIRTPSNYGRRYGQMFSLSFHNLAQQNGISLVPFMLEPLTKIITNTNKSEYIQADGLHPTAKSQPILADYLFSFIHKSL